MKLYRYYDVQYSDGRVGVHLMEFDVVSETRCGVWIMVGFWFGSTGEKPPKDCQKFVSMEADKKYACKTVEEAKASFIARKRRQIRVLSTQIERAEKALFEADNL